MPESTPQSRAEKAREAAAKIYGAGILAFSAIVGFVTAFAYFLAHLKVS
jgi:hypothetical protein